MIGLGCISRGPQPCIFLAGRCWVYRGEMSGNGLPHSDRVDSPGLLPQPTVSSLNTATRSTIPITQQQQQQQQPPSVPVRSPLRPPARSISSQTDSPKSNSRSSRATLETPPLSLVADSALIVDPSTMVEGLPTDHDPLSSFEDILNAVNVVSSEQDLPKPRPQSPILASVSVRSKVLPRMSRQSITGSSTESTTVPTEESATSQSTGATLSIMTKREHALHELLSSERAYCSDLVLVQENHIPLALGFIPLPTGLPTTPPKSSASSARTLSTASDSSTGPLGLPMTHEDARKIFINIVELADFSERFSTALESALGPLIEGGSGVDRVGELFLQVIPELELPYLSYIKKHSAALQHLHNLPRTPALETYLTYTRAIASSLSTAWDLASLLIKPVQRLLKYPLLLAAIIDETPDSHPDKLNLKEARAKMEAVARNVNEQRRREEIVQEAISAKRKAVNVALSASVNLSKMKNLRGGKGAVSDEEHEQKVLVDALYQEMKRVESYGQQFAKNVVDWARCAHNVIVALRAWTLSFGRTIGLTADQQSQAFDAFLQVVDVDLLPVSEGLEDQVRRSVLGSLSALLATMQEPYKVISTMHEQEPFHVHLANMTLSPKNRPTPALLTASNNYIALRGQLASDLPKYLALLHRGIALTLGKFARFQALYWQDVHLKWLDLWERLRVDEDMDTAATTEVWRARWQEVDHVLGFLNLVQHPTPTYFEPAPSIAPSTASHKVRAVLGQLESSTSGMKMSNRSGRLPSVDLHDPAFGSYVSLPQPLRSTSRERNSMGSYSSTQPLSRRSSRESGHNSKGKRRSSDSREQYTHVYQPQPQSYHHDPYAHPPISRRKSMPLAAEALVRKPSNSRRNTSPQPHRSRVVYEDDNTYYYGAQNHHPCSAPVDPTADSRKGWGSYPAPSLSRDNSYKNQKSYDSKAPVPYQNRRRSNSASSVSKGRYYPGYEEAPPMPMPALITGSDRWETALPKYICVAVQSFNSDPKVEYYAFKFHSFRKGEVFEILHEAGHPSIHTKLPFYHDQEEDCLVLSRNRSGMVGWQFTSFLEPILP